MPRVSNRQQSLKWVRQNMYSTILQNSSSSEDLGMSASSDASSKSSCFVSLDSNGTDLELDESNDSEIGVATDLSNVDSRTGEWLELHVLLDSERYWTARSKRFQSKEFSDTFFRIQIPDDLFRQMTRMNKEPFFHLLYLIENHSVFSNNSIYDQAPVSLQLATCLNRLGHSRNGVCLKRTLLVWGISTGSCVNYMVRTVTTLEDIIGHILKWPNRADREVISSEFAKRGFKGCVGLIDGTTLPLAQRPGQHGEVYFDRKSRYSINAQVVCDHKPKILFMSSGMPGTCGDITCLKRSILWDRIHGDTIFDRRQYLLGDLGYVNAPHLVCAFKLTMQQQDREDFNYCVAKARVVNEHYIGLLKNRWFSLREIRTQLNLNKDHEWMCRWIRACGLLHNYVIEQNDLWADLQACPMDPPEGIPMDVHINQGRPAPSRRARVQLRNRVQRLALAFNRQPRGVLWFPSEDL